MRKSVLFLIGALAISSSDAFSLSPSAPQLRSMRHSVRCPARPVALRMQETKGTKESKEDDWETSDAKPPSPAAVEEPEASTPKPAAAAKSQQYNFGKKIDDNVGGPGFNQFDPVLTATQFVSRRFGLVGGLAIVGLLAATEGKEIVQAIFAPPAQKGSGEVVKTDSGLQYVDLVVGPPIGDTVGPGKLIGFNVRVEIGEKVIFDSYKEKPVAFKYGQRPFQNVVCEGLEEGLKSMRIGGKRKMTIPQELAPPGVKLPPGVPLVYEVELTEVLSNYF